MTALDASYAHCRAVAKARAKNFYYSFILLDHARRDAMCAMYAFMRYCDDLSDEQGATREALEQWRHDLTEALQGRLPADPLWPAFADSVARYKIPHEYFHEMIDGVESDLEPVRVQSFAQLYAYCYRVASVVGLTTIHIFGFSEPRALLLAERCGIAFQLTNILRDVREDAALGRQYLPDEDLARFGVSPSELMEGLRTERFVSLMEFEVQRAEGYYREAEPLLEMTDPAARSALWAMIAIYHGVLGLIAESPADVLVRRVSLPLTEKLWIVVRAGVPAMLRHG
ncbi:MAG: farnesyl-diphosphate farnesyltransferase [Bryobacterales bacterium]|nr:farnesyl-diphosphate farnesyltransferase [Bryobacterales bacterium]